MAMNVELHRDDNIIYRIKSSMLALSKEKEKYQEKKWHNDCAWVAMNMEHWNIYFGDRKWIDFIVRSFFPVSTISFSLLYFLYLHTKYIIKFWIYQSFVVRLLKFDEENTHISIKWKKKLSQTSRSSLSLFLYIFQLLVS